MLVRRPLILALALVTITSVILITRRIVPEGSKLEKVASTDLEKVQDGYSSKFKSSPTTACSEDLSWLEAYKLTPVFNYVSRDIITKPGASDRPLVTQVDTPLFNGFTAVDLSQSKTANIDPCLLPLTLDVRHGQLPIPNASNMIFALQTTIGRLRSSIKYLARWLPHTGARLYCVVKEDENTLAEPGEMEDLEKEFAEQGMEVHIINPVLENDRFEQRYFSLVDIMYAARNEKTQWMVTIDDDTFFPSLHELQKMLARHDETKPQYISALSENWWAVDHYGLMGFGGASIILSVPMVKIMDEHVHDCKDHPSTASGDVTIMECIYRFSTAKLTNIPELYQLDIKNDLSGFYESGRPVLSLHHWKDGPEKFDLDRHQLIADICDDCFLQRWQFPNDLVLSNGFSIHTYPQGHLRGKKGGVLGTGVAAGSGPVPDKIQKVDLLEMEQTWDEDFDVTHSLNPLRPKLPKGTKVQYKILDSMFVDRRGQKILRQVYLKKGQNEGKDEVMVLNWIPGDEKDGGL